MFPLPHQSGPVLPAAAAAIFLGRDASLLNDSTTKLRAIARRRAFKMAIGTQQGFEKTNSISAHMCALPCPSPR
jgi:hypothetical protein